MTNIVLLQQYIEKSGLKKGYIAECMGLSKQGFHNKINGKTDFSVKEILVLCNLLNISVAEREEIFFTIDVDEKSTINASA